MRRPSPRGLASATGLRSLFAGRPAKARSISSPAVLASMSPTIEIGQLVAREDAAHIVAQVVGGDARHAFPACPGFRGRKDDRGTPSAHQRRLASSFGLVVSRRSDASICPRTRSTASASKRGAVERKPQQIEGLVAVLVERAQRAVEIVAADLEAELDGVVLQPLVEGLAVEIAGALVEQVGGEIGGAGLVRLVLGWSRRGRRN